MKTRVVIPVFNEAESLPGLFSALPRQKTFDYLVIDDGSTDGSGDIAIDMGFEVVKHEKNKGKPAAVKSAINLTGQNYDFFVVFDGDGQHPVDSLGVIIELLKSHRIVKGDRFNAKSPQIGTPIDRRILNVAISAIIKEITGWHINDPGCGLIGLHCEILEKLSPSLAFDEWWEIEFIIRLWQSLYGQQNGNPIFEFPIPAVYELPAQKQREKYMPCNLENRIQRLLDQTKKIMGLLADQDAIVKSISLVD